MLSSAYLAHDKDIPSETMTSLIDAGGEIIVGADANARHPLWGSSGLNKRGDLLFDYINSCGMRVCNQGSTPTFIFQSRTRIPFLTTDTFCSN
ncbi:hypothetical protein [Streptomyces sp. IBSBF 2390]|uniref:hypothetical protein n=1 Tax=Streptomyces sp. IBSBF 2390 TaxID=2903533 RepID=UPI003FA71DE9